MLRALDLAKNALGSAAPNPMVGAVIVHHGQVIGEGYTSAYGGPHAEVNAINSVADRELLKEAEIYVSLEPCAHFGKTPPCADLIVKCGIPRVYVGIEDPNPKVAGGGIKKLREAGCLVETAVLKEEVAAHHKRFLTYQLQQRPYIILKWAESKDGYMAPETASRNSEQQPYWISGPYSRQKVHQWRAEEAAILVGTQTVLDDNPELTVRQWSGRSPLRVVLDRQLRIPETFRVLDGSVKTIVLTEEQKKSDKAQLIYEQIDFSGNVSAAVCSALYRHEVQSLLVEGGARTLETFIREGNWDEARRFTGPVSLGGGLKAPDISGTTPESTEIGTDRLDIIYNA